jgi:glycosyltransferase involved in cell wall biosynthesis
MDGLRILIVATKAPWPAVDGGRLVLLTTIRALAAAGHRLELVAPLSGSEADRTATAAALAEVCVPHLVPVGPRPAPVAAAIGAFRGLPVTVVRHTLPKVRDRVEELLAGGGFDVVHAEQLHALPQAEPAQRLGVPLLHRAHNVESLLWAFSAEHRGPPLRSILAMEARRVAACEAKALDEVDCTVALTESDRRLLAEMAPAASVHAVAPSFPGELPPGGVALDGTPAVVTLVSPSWAPSRDAVRELVNRSWPEARRRLPRAVLHIFGGGAGLPASPGVVVHPAPADSRDAFPVGAVALIPIRHPTGVPMKALEAWARGLPLVVEPATAMALTAEDGREVVVADPSEGWANALERLAGDNDLRQRVVAGGRRALAERHDPEVTTARLMGAYRIAINARSSESD